MTARTLVACLMLATLASCGVDGEPERPEPRPVQGLSVTGTATIGLSGRG